MKVLVAFCLVNATIFGCKPGIPPKVLSEAVSPDGLLKSQVVEHSVGGATGSRFYVVSILKGKFGTPVARIDDIRTRDDQPGKLEVYWIDVRTLGIRYPRARVLHFTNFWHSKEYYAFKRVIEVRLVPTVGRSIPYP